jgi:hypothetical protein
MLTIELGMGQANQKLLPSFVYPQRHSRIEIPFGEINGWEPVVNVPTLCYRVTVNVF